MNTLCEFLPGLEEPNIIIASLNREAAQKNGDLTYEGSPCKYGHTNRYIKDDKCAGCKKKYYDENRERILKYKQRYFIENIEKIAARDKKYYENNKEKVNEAHRKYLNKRYHNDPVFRARTLLGSQLRQFCKNRNGYKGGRTHELLGYSAEDLCKHLESLFKDGMTWENQGEWHIDHRIPQSYFTSIDQMKECFALENLKPEWGEWNIKKGNRFIG